MRHQPPKIFFLHIPKCAGNSVWHALWDISGRRRSYQVAVRKHILAFQGAPASKLEAYDVVGGHGPLNMYAEKLSDMPERLKFTILRHPLERIVSAFNYISAKPRHPFHKKVSNDSFSNYVRDASMCRPNMMSQLISGEPCAEKTLEILENWFDLYCDFDRIDDLVAELYRSAGRLPKSTAHKNKGVPKFKVSDIDPKLISFIEETHSEDLKLYKLIQSRNSASQKHINGLTHVNAT